MTRDEIIQLVHAERDRQDAKFGEQWGKTYFEWASILGEEFGEVCQAVNDLAQLADDLLGGVVPDTMDGVDELAHIRDELVQVAAVAIAWLEFGF